jgi:hypothetical protein
MTLGVRGILEVELIVETMSRDAHSGNAHILPSAAWRTDPSSRFTALRGGHDPGSRVFMIAVVKPTPRDLVLSDALPYRGSDVPTGVFGVEGFVFGREGKQLNRSVFAPTCNIQGITSGYQGAGAEDGDPGSARLQSWTSAWCPIKIRMRPTSNCKRYLNCEWLSGSENRKAGFHVASEDQS